VTTAPRGDDGAATVVEIAADVTAGRRTARSVLEACLVRHAATAGRLNALVQPRLEEARAEAAALDARAASGEEPGGPLAGVPVSVKECFPVRGLTTTLGIRSRRGAIDAHDAPLVERLRLAGAVIVGKANVPQAMYFHETTNPVWGRTNHPLDPRRNPGGSSGGDAALVAAGVVPLAVGNDLAGSLRQPAHACGIATIMPRSAALGTGGSFDTMPDLEIVRQRSGFLARSVDDLALACAAVGVPAGNAASRPRVARVGWWDTTGPVPGSPAVLRAVREAVAALERAGIETVRLDGGVADEAAWLHLAILAADGGSQVRRLFGRDWPMRGVRRLLWIAGLPRRWRPAVAALARALGSGIEAEGVMRTGPRDAVEFAALVAARDDLFTRFSGVIAGCDCVIGPVSALPAMRHGAAARLILAAAPCLAANLFDLAAGAVPVTRVRDDEARGRHWSFDPVLRAAAATDRGSAGLPIGVQVIAAPGGDEATVLAVMRLIEAGTRA
jgi:fatty acid amide hydrolase